MSPTRLRVFVSSVQRELARERRELGAFLRNDALLRRFFDVFLFEELPARDRRADEVYLAEVEAADLYLGLFGREYGTEDAEGISPTEREFDRATALGKPRLVYLWSPDGTPRHPKMAALVRKAEAELVRREVGSLPELRSAVYASLIEELVRHGLISSRPFDAAACPEARLEDLSAEKVREFLGRAHRKRGFPLEEDAPLPAVLAHLNLLDGDSPSRAAVLLFGERPQRFLPTSEVKCLHFHGTEVAKPIPSYQVYKGTAFELVDQAVDFVLSKIAVRVGTRAESASVRVEYELPPDAVREAIVNAVAHRDYASAASVQVMLFADRLEVWNPGHLPPDLTFDQLTRPHPSLPRNPLVAEPMFLAGYIERAGTGTLDMIALCREAGLPPPEFRQDGGTFLQVLRRRRAATSGVTPQVTPQVAPQVTPQVGEPSPVDRLLALLDGEMTREEIQGALGLRDLKHVREAYLQPALEAGLIEMTIPGKPTSRLQKYRRTAKGAARLTGKKD